MSDSRSYRIRTDILKDESSSVHVNLTQTYDTFQILSVELTQSNAYKLYQSDYGVLVGRIYANGGVGVPNAKVSVFIEADGNDTQTMDTLYGFSNTMSKNVDGVRYNLLPDYVDDACHQTVGTFPNKRYVLDNDDIIEVFEKYYRYTTTTNSSGDYMIFGVPKGGQRIHVDVDLSDIGILSQRPRDMIYKGYDPNQFESPNKFKKDTNLGALVQIISHDAGVYIHPFWGDTSDEGEDIAITRYDFEIPYRFEPTCVFMGSAITTTGGAAIGKNCTPTESLGRMRDIVTGEGNIEMIRKTLDGRIEEFSIKGNRNIDGDGVWCYQIPMNLDYMTTDEYGNLVPTDDPARGIPTRARVRFRVSLDESPADNTARKRARYLIPNNPRDNEDYPDFNTTKQVDYEFGTNTKEENFRDLFWNNVYTVKSYIPRIQKYLRTTERRHTGIKLVKNHGDNNPMPYNNMSIKLTFTYRLLCVLAKVFVQLIVFVNRLIGILSFPLCILAETFLTIAKGLCFSILGIKPLCWLGAPFKAIGNLFYSMVPSCVKIDSEFCGDNMTHAYTFYPGCDLAKCAWEKTKKKHAEDEKKDGKTPEEMTTPTRGTEELYNCIENALAEDNDVTSYNFSNDWINGTLYMPMWFRYIKHAHRIFFGLFKTKERDQWCSADRPMGGLPKLIDVCSIGRGGSTVYRNHDGKRGTAYYVSGSVQCPKEKKKNVCHKRVTSESLDYGLIVAKQTMLGQTVYYYKPVEYSRGKLKVLFATDLVLIGSLNDCDRIGTPQFFKYIENSTYIMPDTVLSAENETSVTMDKDGKMQTTYGSNSVSESSGADWGNSNGDLCNKDDKYGEKSDGGLFFSIGCSSIRTTPKSCVNLSRVCEAGVTLDHSLEVTVSDGEYERIPPDGFISDDEVYGESWRSMFATMNGNNLKTKVDIGTGFPVYDFRYLRADAFDNSLYYEMKARQSQCGKVNFKNNYKLEKFSAGYYDFRMGLSNFFYDDEIHAFPRYENSFYFYFGLKYGKTAIDKFNSLYYSQCTDDTEYGEQYTVLSKPNSWCSDITDDNDDNDGYVAMDLSKMASPLTVTFSGSDGATAYRAEIAETASKFYIAQNPIDKLDTQGYKRVALKIPNTDDTVNSIKNGRYVVTIEDANGDITQTVLILEPEQMKFDTVVSAFEDDDNVLLDTHNNERAEIAKDNVDVDGSFTPYTRDIGGTICLKGMRDEDEDGNAEYVYSYEINVTTTDEELLNPIAHAKVVNKELTDSTENVLLPLPGDDTDYTEPIVIIGVPKPDIDYTIKVLRLCGNEGLDTDDMTTMNVTVEGPRPMKLYINDVIDYDVIKDWGTGIDDVQCGEPNILKSNTGEFTNWDKLSTANYDLSVLDSITGLVDMMDSYADIFDEVALEQIKGYIKTGTGDVNGVINGAKSDAQTIRGKLNVLIAGDEAPFKCDETNEDETQEQVTVEGFNFEAICKQYHMDDPASIIEWKESDDGKGSYCFTGTENYEGEDEPAEDEKDPKLFYIQKDGKWYSYPTATYCDINGYITNTISIIDGHIASMDELLNEDEGIKATVEGIRSDFITNMKRTFWKICEGEVKTFDFTLDTQNKGNLNGKTYPFYEAGFHNETTDEETGVNYLDASYTCPDENKSVQTIENVTIPTVTYKDSPYYGGGSPIQVRERDDLYSQVKFGGTEKKQYYIRAINLRQRSIPPDDGSMNHQYFSFPLLDKTFTSEYNMWPSIVGMPNYFYNPADDSSPKHIYMFGLFAGYILNGMPSNVEDGNRVPEGELTQFETQSLGYFNVKLETFYGSNEDEDTMPVKRLITGGDLPQDFTVTIFGHRITVSPETVADVTQKMKSYGNYQNYIYIPILPTDDTLNLKDGLECEINEEINGAMSVGITETEIVSPKTKGSITVEVEGVYDENVKINYYWYKLDEEGKSHYPLSGATHVTAVGDIGISSVTLKADSVIQYSSNPIGEDPRSNKFSIKKNGGGYVYAVAEIKDGNKIKRCLTPLYDLNIPTIYGEVYNLFMIDTIEPDEDAGAEEDYEGCVKRAAFALAYVELREGNYGNSDKNNERTYLNHFPSTIEFEATIHDGGNVRGNARMEGSESVCVIEASDENVKGMSERQRGYRDGFCGADTHFVVTDTTGMTYEAQYVDCSGERRHYYRDNSTTTDLRNCSTLVTVDLMYNDDRDDERLYWLCEGDKKKNLREDRIRMFNKYASGNGNLIYKFKAPEGYEIEGDSSYYYTKENGAHVQQRFNDITADNTTVVTISGPSVITLKPKTTNG